MKAFKQILVYLIWISLALLLGVGYMWILLMVNDKSSTGFIQVVGDVIYEYVLIYVGLRGGCVIALLFILVDVFYLKKKLNNSLRSTSIRFLVLLDIAIIVGTIHYVLEQVVDVI